MALENLVTPGLIPENGVYVQLARFLLVLTIGFLATRFGLLPLVTRLAGRRNSSKKARSQLRNIATIIGFFVSFTAALQAGEFGNLVTILGTVAAALTVAVGFGMRDEVGNIMAGVFIHLDNPFVKGDYIQVADEEGEVQDISLRATYLNGHSSEEIMIPNNKVSSNNVKNYTRGIKTKAAIRFRLPPDRVESVSELVERIAREDNEILDSPEPSTLYRRYEDDRLLFELRYWVRDSSDSKKIKSRVLQRFNREAVENGLFEEKQEAEKAVAEN